MMRNRSVLGIVGSALLLCGLPMFGRAASVTLQRDAVIPVVVEESLSLKDSQPGDRFSARVQDINGRLPKGTVFAGRVVAVHASEGGKSASIDLEFTQILGPHGETTTVDAVPVLLKDKFLSKDADGNLTLRPEARTEGAASVGTLLKHPSEETALQALIDGPSDHSPADLVVTRGEKLGVVINRPVTWDLSPAQSVDKEPEPLLTPKLVTPYFGAPAGPQAPTRVLPKISGPSTYRTQELSGYRNSDSLQVQVGQQIIVFDRGYQPYRIGNTVMVPLTRAADQLGFQVDFGRKTNIYVEGDGFTIRLTQGSREYHVNGQVEVLPRAVTHHNDIIYVPLELLNTLTKENILVNGNKIGA